MGVEGGVFVGELGQRLAEFVAVFLVVHVDFHLDNGRRHVDGLQQHGLFLVAEGIAGAGELHADEGHDFTDACLRNLLTLLGLDAEDTSHAFVFTFIGIIDAHAVLQLAAEDADEGLLSHVRVVDELEGESSKGLVVRRLKVDVFLFIVGVVGDDGAEVGGRGEIGDDSVEQELDAFVLVGGTAQHGSYQQFDGGLADGFLQQLFAHLFVIEVKLSDFVIEVGEFLNHGAAGFQSLRHQLGGNVAHDAFFLLESDGFHHHEVHHALEFALGTDGHLNGHRIGTKVLVHLHHHFLKVSAHAVHLVHESDTGHAVLVGLVPHGLALRFHTAHGTEYRHHAVDDAQRTLHLDGEVHVAGSVDQVDLMVVPLRGDGCGGDGDAALLLLLHEVHGGLPVVGLAYLAVYAREEEDSFRYSGLASVNVRRDSDVS